jgi:transcriptional regulator with XRE-family HTH domain
LRHLSGCPASITGLSPRGRRKVAGLRREEVAALAGVSTDYYTRLEQGRVRTASRSVLEALADALRLDDAERTYLLNLAAPDGPARSRRGAHQQEVSPRLPHERQNSKG